MVRERKSLKKLEQLETRYGRFRECEEKRKKVRKKAFFYNSHGRLASIRPQKHLVSLSVCQTFSIPFCTSYDSTQSQ